MAANRAIHGNKINRIIWAIDAYEKPGPTRRHAVAILQSLSKQTKATIEPVYVLSPSELSLSIEFTPPWVIRYKPSAEAALKQVVKNEKIEGMEKPRVLVERSASIRRAVDLLAAHAKKRKADVIVVSTHARKGLSRLLLGSFAETLILHSTVPVLIAEPKQQPIASFSSILFPTDLSPYSRKIFHSTLCLAAQLSSSITIFHSIPNPIEPIFQSGMFLLGGSWVPVGTYFSQDVERRKSLLSKWVDVAKKFGIKADFHITEQAGSISASLVEYAKKKKFKLIAMAPQSGPVASTLIGSVTRQVVRNADCPVWILHYPKK